MRQGELVFNGQEAFPTMIIAAGTQVGDAVALTAAATAGRGTDGQLLLGKVLKLEADGFGTVAIWGAGFTDIPSVGTLAVGPAVLVVDGAGKAKVAANGVAGPFSLVNIAQNGTANIKL